MSKLEDQYIVTGQSLLYALGVIDIENEASLSVFGSEIEINVDLRRSGVSSFSAYDRNSNSFIVNGQNVTRDNVGMYKVKVEVSYTDPKDRVQYFSNLFYLHVSLDSNDLEIQPVIKEEFVKGDKTINSNDFDGVVKLEP